MIHDNPTSSFADKRPAPRPRAYATSRNMSGLRRCSADYFDSSQPPPYGLKVRIPRWVGCDCYVSRSSRVTIVTSATNRRTSVFATSGLRRELKLCRPYGLKVRIPRWVGYDCHVLRSSRLLRSSGPSRSLSESQITQIIGLHRF